MIVVFINIASIVQFVIGWNLDWQVGEPRRGRRGLPALSFPFLAPAVPLPLKPILAVGAVAKWFVLGATATAQRGARTIE